jgi:hypothetical protein
LDSTNGSVAQKKRLQAVALAADGDGGPLFHAFAKADAHLPPTRSKATFLNPARGSGRISTGVS